MGGVSVVNEDDSVPRHVLSHHLDRRVGLIHRHGLDEGCDFVSGGEVEHVGDVAMVAEERSSDRELMRYEIDERTDRLAGGEFEFDG